MRYCKQENEPQSKLRYVHRTQDEIGEGTWKMIIGEHQYFKLERCFLSVKGYSVTVSRS